MEKSISELEKHNKKIVTYNFVIRDEAGKILSSNGKPVTSFESTGSMHPAFEKRVVNLNAGDKVEFVLSPEEAYGAYDNKKVRTVKKELFGTLELKPGLMFQLPTKEGRVGLYRIIEIKDDEVVVDGNHPFAGKSLHYTVEILKIRPATFEEMWTGKPKGP
jgi:FKBP-type peptidyl-prolyl cis-trans isomerase SlyD